MRHDLVFIRVEAPVLNLNCGFGFGSVGICRYRDHGGFYDGGGVGKLGVSRTVLEIEKPACKRAYGENDRQRRGDQRNAEKGLSAALRRGGFGRFLGKSAEHAFLCVF